MTDNLVSLRTRGASTEVHGICNVLQSLLRAKQLHKTVLCLLFIIVLWKRTKHRVFHFEDLGLQVPGQKGNNFEITENQRLEILVWFKSHNIFFVNSIWWTSTITEGDRGVYYVVSGPGYIHVERYMASYYFHQI